VGEGQKTAESGIEIGVKSADLVVLHKKLPKERERERLRRRERKREWQWKDGRQIRVEREVVSKEQQRVRAL
jgi:hypothetical protein